jgi:hypothetical protein
VEVLAVLSLVALALGAAAVVWMDFSSRSGLDPLRDAVSDYGTTPLKWIYRFQVIAFGVSALLLLAGFVASDLSLRAVGLVWLGVYGVSRIAIAGFMIDRDVAAPTREGRIHVMLATLAFTAIAVAATALGSDLEGSFDTLGWFVAAAAIATAIFRLVPPLARWFGAVERLLYAMTVVWIAASAVELLS